GKLTFKSRRCSAEREARHGRDRFGLAAAIWPMWLEDDCAAVVLPRRRKAAQSPNRRMLRFTPMSANAPIVLRAVPSDVLHQT
ncbi:MAG: hypothetical protein MJH10_17695, partial [Epibacterium sp.]|nr:hypothetical protein [Epibacterium sp.]